MIVFLGSSHAAKHLEEAAIRRGIEVARSPYTPVSPDLIFISEDTPTNERGERDLTPIRALIDSVKHRNIPIVLTSQVPPGFTRSLGIKNIYHQAETLRIKDAAVRALHPDYIVVGYAYSDCYSTLPKAYVEYLYAFDCALRFVTYEVAEFSKIAVNMMLAAQVDATNRLATAATKVGADWNAVAQVLKLDKRIGPEAYLTPGRWQDSKHLLRDSVTLEGICK